ncbi:Serine/threonine-protein kinase PknB [Novipirellula aureliae]|uniref:Serine/threonine-protein kinase PknB n=1 Tax=Novipirellula aureliae TaxID=2527966 RepID=A0A5C6EE87_9BACT|nr:protein kinase [Novipirellula aureliae]TWU46041.1 Serine/threonine-protein kinase PknB [Novipirellula aureliae]
MMTVTPTECPPATRLRAYASGRLPETQSDSIFEHLRECESCASALETIDDGEDSLIAELRQPDPLASFAHEPSCQTAVAKALAVLANTAELPRQIGEYEVTRPLGRGGMGSVYLARHNKLGRQVALKVLATHRLSDPRMRQRFEAEMRAVGQLSHPNIVTAHDAREIEGTAVLVTEFIDGLDLGQLVQSSGPLGIADACQIIRQVAVALAYTDSQGFVHRDVKPSNIMLSRSGEVKLLDLGLARFEYGDPDHPEIAGPELTGTGQTMGTADYIAPEQVTDSRSVDIRADIYSLGCTLMKLLTGHAPFADENHETPFAKMTAHVSTPAPRLKQCLPDAPKELASLVDSMLQKDPTKRPQSPMEIAERLEPFTVGNDLMRLSQTKYVPVAVAARSTQTQAERDRHVPIWVALATGLMGLVVGLVLGITITIEYPDGTKTQVNAPAGSQVTITETPGVTPGQRSEITGQVSQGELAPVVEIGDGTIRPYEPLGFIVLLNSDEVSDAELSAAKALLHSQISSDPKHDKVVTTDTGIWIKLKEDVAAPIVENYNGNRYALASGSSANRIEWGELKQHAPSLRTTFDANQSSCLEVEFDDILATKFQLLTRNNMGHPLAIVSEGTIAVAPKIRSEIRKTARITGAFSEQEVQDIMRTLDGGLRQPDLPNEFGATNARNDLYRLQGVWIGEAASNGIKTHPLLVAIDGQRIYYFTHPRVGLILLGTLSLDSEWSGNEIDMAMRFPRPLTALGIYEFESDGTLRLAAKTGNRRPRDFTDEDGFPNLVLQRMGDIPRSPQELPGLVDKTGPVWLTVLNDLIRYQAFSLDEVAESAQSQAPARSIVNTVNSMKRIGIAFHNFHDAYRKFPGSQNVREGRRGGSNGDKDPYPFSWRVALLPFIEQQELFEQYRFDEPWDGEHNLTLLDQMPDVYRTPFASSDQRKGETNFLGIATDDGGLGITGHSVDEFTGGTSNAALILTSKKSVPWTKPEDLTDTDVEPNEEIPLLILRADGSVEMMNPIDEVKLQKMLRPL